MGQETQSLSIHFLIFKMRRITLVSQWRRRVPRGHRWEGGGHTLGVLGKASSWCRGTGQGQGQWGRLGSKEHQRLVCKFPLSGQVASQPLPAHPRNKELSSLDSPGCSIYPSGMFSVDPGSAPEDTHLASPLALSAPSFQPALGDWPGP